MLGARLRALRKKRGDTLADVGARAGLSVSFLSDIERGQAQPSLGTLGKLAAYYQLAIGDLLAEVDIATLGEGHCSSLEDFLKDTEIEPDMIGLLMRIERKAKRRAETKDDWKRYYYSLRAILGY